MGDPKGLDPVELGQRMIREEVRCEPYNLGADYRVLIVSYGTMSRVCRTVVDNFKEKGIAPR